jgi:phosphonate transport system permease protein
LPAKIAFPTRPRPSSSRIGVTVVLLLLLGTAIWSMIALRINIASFVDGYANAIAFLKRTVPLDFPPLPELWPMIGQTLAITVVGTALSFALSVPLALLAAENTTINKIIRLGGRGLIVVARALPEIVLAMFFLRVFGLGALPGILALGLHSVGMVAKLLTDASEELDPGPREALRAVGATRLQQIAGAIIPELRPAMVATVLHRFDINLRGSVLLGFVGVGGIGLEIASALNTLNYRRGLALTSILLALCVATELISGMIRTALLGRDYRRGKPTLTSRLSRRIRGRRRPTERNLPARPDQPRAVTGGWVHGPTSGAAPGSVALSRVSPPWNAVRIRGAVWIGLTLGILLASLMGSQITFQQLADGLAKGLQALGLYLPPGTGGIFGELLASMAQTVQMAMAGTLIGLVMALPIGVLAARNVSPSPRVATLFRVLIVCVRAIPGLIIGIVFVVITGLGSVAGALALSIGAIGFLSKIIADSIEETDIRVQEAIRAAGAHGRQIFFAATIRQAAPSIASHVMHQFDNDIRGATGLGVIGAGGIGYYMMNAQRVLQYDVVTSCMLMILVSILAVEALALWTRHEVK